MSGWSVVRMAAPVCVGLGLVALRPSWVSVATLGLLIVVGAWLDSQERRADDIEHMEQDMTETIGAVRLETAKNAAEIARLRAMPVEQKLATTADLDERVGNLSRRISSTEEQAREHSARLDAMAQQRKGPIL